MNEILLIAFNACAFAGIVVIGYLFLRKNGRESETFARNHVEEAMKIKAKQYEIHSEKV